MQHIPQVDRSDVERVIRRDFGAQALAEVSSVLDLYGKEGFHREIHRVHLDVLKLAGGNLAQLKKEVESACCDYRDTMVAAEYPNWGNNMLRIDTLSEEERKRISEADRDQYEAWLRRD